MRPSNSEHCWGEQKLTHRSFHPPKFPKSSTQHPSLTASTLHAAAGRQELCEDTAGLTPPLLPTSALLPSGLLARSKGVLYIMLLLPQMLLLLLPSMFTCISCSLVYRISSSTLANRTKSPKKRFHQQANQNSSHLKKQQKQSETRRAKLQWLCFQ